MPNKVALIGCVGSQAIDETSSPGRLQTVLRLIQLATSLLETPKPQHPQRAPIAPKKTKTTLPDGVSRISQVSANQAAPVSPVISAPASQGWRSCWCAQR